LPTSTSAKLGQTSRGRFGLLSWRRQFRRKLNLRQTRSERGISAQATAKISRWAFRGLLFCCSRVSDDASTRDRIVRVWLYLSPRFPNSKAQVTRGGVAVAAPSSTQNESAPARL